MLHISGHSTPSGSSNTPVCPKANSDLKVFFRDEPPFQNKNNNIRGRCGLLCDLVKDGLSHCFKRYNCNATNTVWRGVSSQDDLWWSIVNETADIALPVNPSLSSSLTDKMADSHNENITLITVLKSPGLAVLIDYNVCKNRIQKLTTNTILSAWPICVVMLLLAGISGITIWALVSVV